MRVQCDHPCVASVGNEQRHPIGDHDQSAWSVELPDSVAAGTKEVTMLRGQLQVPGVALGNAWGDQVRTERAENMERPTIVDAVKPCQGIHI